MDGPVGRRRQQQALDQALARVVAGERHVVHVHGPAGVGKSTILADVRSRAAAGGWTVVDTGLSRAETALSWAGLSILLREIRDDVVKTIPPVQAAALGAALGQNDGVADPLLVAGATTHLFQALARTAPLLVVVDDLHWLDLATSGALSYAIRGADSARVAFVVASRPVELPVDLRRVTPSERLVDLPLEGLSLAGLKELLERRCDVTLQRVELIRLHATTGGNPLHAIEAGRLLRAGGPLEQSLVPPSLLSLVEEHLAMLPPTAVLVLRAAALSARPDITMLESLFTTAEVETALLAAERAGVIDVDGTSVRFCHPTFVAALVRSLGVLERRRLESRLSEVVADAEEQVLHRAAATVGTDYDVAAAMDAAADAAERRGAIHLAVDRSQRALELTPSDDRSSVRRRRLALAERLVNVGDYLQSLDLHRQVLSSEPTDDERWSAARGITVATIRAVGVTAAVPTLADLAAAAGDDPERRAHLWRIRMRIFFHEDIDEAERAASAWVEVAKAHPERDERRVVAELAVCVTRVLRGQSVDPAAILQLALDTWPQDRSRAIIAVDELMTWTDQLDILVEELPQVMSNAEREGRTLVLLNGLDQMADVCMRLGRWDEAEACLEHFLDLSITAFDGAATVPRGGELAYLDALRGRRVVRVPEEPARQTMSKVEWAQLLCRRGAIAWLRGDAPAAVPDLMEADELLRSVGIVDPGVLIFRCDLVQALLDVGRVDDAMAAVVRLEEVAADSRRPRAAAEAARAGASVMAAQGDLVGAATKCEEALVRYRELSAPYEQGRTLLLAGAVSRRAGRRSDARERLSAARALFDGLGAIPFVRRTDEELARVGGESTGGITPTERQIARLVVAGKSNAQIASSLFVSVRTVESNLTKLYRKVGVRSRTELVAHLASRAMD